MYCCHCGKEIDNDSRFCPFCGGEQPPVPGQGPTAGDFLNNSGEGSKVENAIEHAGESIGKGIDDAINEFKNSNGAQAIQKGVSTAGEKARNVMKNWRDYLTLENMEFIAPILLLMPLIMGLVRMLLGRVFGVVFWIPFIGGVFKLVYGLIKLVFVVASAAGLCATGYVLYKKPEKRKLFGYISLGASACGFLSCLGMFFNWKYVNIIFGLAALVWAADAISRVCLQKKGMESEPVPQADIDAYKTFYSELREKMNSEKKAKEAGTFQPGPDADVKGFDPNAAAAMNEGYGYGYGQPAPESYFDGSGAELFGLLLLTSILGAVTCGLAVPWMLCKIFKWRKTHTVIDGRRLDFNGTGGDLFGHWILWELLTGVTCGIYGIFMFVALRRWEMKHTFYQDQPETIGSFDGNSFEYFGLSLVQGLLSLVTCGIATPWTITWIENWQMEHSVVGHDRMRYDGTGLGLLGQYLIVAILTVITCGIYSAWGIVRLDKYLFSHVHVDETALY